MEGRGYGGRESPTALAVFDTLLLDGGHFMLKMTQTVRLAVSR